jgi:hypothetical protein
LQHSVYGLYRVRILRSVSRARSFQSLPKAEAPILELDLSWAVGVEVGAESEFNFSAAAALGFVPKQQPDLEITFCFLKYHVIDMEKGRVSHVVCQRFPHGENRVVERRTVGIAFVVLQVGLSCQSVETFAPQELWCQVRIDARCRRASVGLD